MSPLEIAGVIVSALAIWLTAKRRMLCWPVGLVSVALYGWIFFDAKLYSDMLLQGAFAVLQVYGWQRWLAQRASEADGSAAPAGDVAPVTGVRPLQMLPDLIAAVVGSALLGLPFTAITLFAMREARRLHGERAAGLMGYATASYGVGQILGPLVAAPLAARFGSFSPALWVAVAALLLGAAGFAATAAGRRLQP
ncbi:YbfB/YjiJ family MFS transporter [Burkholderia sp. Se-20373]|uniref:nicotinamide mononucleotide transporter family protein n=1 Tax=Burkholderia sp. Se-20373 TaxID=2703898 RepID=UPI001981312F|nr:nicotinamide mononucleotide transporter family protein [Burkholderia sp. Se-20373]MBN3750134.1 YbfB/YjiJ family MFS transporter [Burkholderia sp. Se-20373]